MKDATLFEVGSDLHENADIGMYYCGKRIETLHHTYGPKIRNHYLLVLINKGEATFFHKNGTVKLKAHDMLVMCPGERIHYVANTPWSIQWVGLYGQTVEYYMKRLAIDGDHPVVHIEQYYEMEKLLDELYNSSGDRFEYTRCYQISLIYKFFSLLLLNSSKKTARDIEDSAKKIMDYNFDKDISIQQIARTLYTDPAYLTREFTKKYGLAPKEYMMKKRMALAKKLLCETEASVRDIANSVGYADSLYFSRIFKKKEGLSPLLYRKKFR